MRAPAVVAIALTAAVIGASTAGWVLSSDERARNGVIPTNIGYRGPASVPLGDVAGAASFGAAIRMPNPLGDGPVAVESGKKLFRAMNCAGCHGYTGGGGMGPALNDHYWRYGGAPSQIYNSIYEGRPQGMPSWGRALPADQLWRLTAYVSSLGGGVPPAQAEAALHGDTAGRTVRKAQDNAAEGGNGLEGQ
jgi:mono/diheme cytochrome c family protein